MHKDQQSDSPGVSVPAPVRVMYDGSCPICSREIRHYQRLAEPGVCAWTDVSDAAVSVPSGLSRQVLMDRFHVQTPDGQWLSGAQAFVALWQYLPRWRYLAMVCKWPGVLWLLERLYTLFLVVRPVLQSKVGR